VAIVSGGGSGHEPAHAGFVGRGMLTAAVCGDVFASPSVDAILAAILAVTGPLGCLLIVKNYTGDRLNFGLAAERARALGKKVEIVIVRDDIALPEIAQPRGIAGVMFVEKIAGHYAAKGWNLQKVAKVAQKAAERTMLVHPPVLLGPEATVGRVAEVPSELADLFCRRPVEFGLGAGGDVPTKAG